MTALQQNSINSSQIFLPLFLKCFHRAYQNSELPPSLSQGTNSLTPKSKKDLLLIENWHPVSLLDNNYKILALVL